MTEFETPPPPSSTADIVSLAGTSACPLSATWAAGLLLDAAGVQAGDMLLDLESGLGHGAGLASQRGAIATGVDRREVLLDQAKRLYPNALFYPANYPANAELLAFASGFFAVVIHHRGLQQPPSPTALAEAFRVLMPGGRYAALWLAAGRSPASAAAPEPGIFIAGEVPADLYNGCMAAGFTEVRYGAVTFSGSGAADWTAFRISAAKPR